MRGIRKHLPGGLLAVALVLIATVGWAVPDAPDSVQLDSLSRYFAGVEFDHAMHNSFAEDCATCHHHTTGSAPLKQECALCHSAGHEAADISCNACHVQETFSAEYLREKSLDINRYHTDKLGLKGAYHQACMGCHQEMGGPLGCEECHDRNQQGDAFYHAGIFAPTGGTGTGAGH
jgi:hypothetical protein